MGVLKCVISSGVICLRTYEQQSKYEFIKRAEDANDFLVCAL